MAKTGRPKGVVSADKPSSIIQLTCKHTAILWPLPSEGDCVYCRLCADYRFVLNAHAEWRLRCGVLGCRARFGRHGADGMSAKRAASRHLMKKPDHVVEMFMGDELMHTYRSGQEPLAEMVSDRQAGQEETHRLLREAVDKVQRRGYVAPLRDVTFNDPMKTPARPKADRRYHGRPAVVNPSPSDLRRSVLGASEIPLSPGECGF